MGESGPSQLQSAFINYLNSIDSTYRHISRNAEKYERCIFVLKTTIFFTSAIISYVLIVIYSKGFSNFFINVACFIVALLCFFVLLYREYVPWRNMFDMFRKTFHCSWNSSTVSTKDEGIRTEEHVSCQLASLHNATGVQTVRPLAAQHDESEEQFAHQHVEQHGFEERTVLFEFRNCFRSRKMLSLGNIFCCPRSSCPTDSTEELRIHTEDFTASQNSALHNATEDYEPNTFQATSEEVSTKLQTMEQRLLGYLLSSTEGQESLSNEYP